MKERILRATHGSSKTPLIIGDIELPCYVLEDGTRVFSGRGMQNALGYSPKSSGKSFQLLLKNRNLEKFLNPELIEKLNQRIAFIRPGSGGSQPDTYGYEATLLVDLCNAILEAKKNGALKSALEYRIAEYAETIVRAVAKVGIIALIDEVTGYQEVRDKKALQEILARYISPELLPWTKKFPDEFYREMFRLRGWQYTPISVRRPILLGKLTNDIVYERLAPGVLSELKRLTPKDSKGRRKYRYHQWLTLDVGNPKLAEHLVAVIVLMRASSNWAIFHRLIQRALPKVGANIPLPLEDEDQDI